MAIEANKKRSTLHNNNKHNMITKDYGENFTEMCQKNNRIFSNYYIPNLYLNFMRM